VYIDLPDIIPNVDLRLLFRRNDFFRWYRPGPSHPARGQIIRPAGQGRPGLAGCDPASRSGPVAAVPAACGHRAGPSAAVDIMVCVLAGMSDPRTTGTDRPAPFAMTQLCTAARAGSARCRASCGRMGGGRAMLSQTLPHHRRPPSSCCAKRHAASDLLSVNGRWSQSAFNHLFCLKRQR
jgi:hypothetical protein